MKGLKALGTELAVLMRFKDAFSFSTLAGLDTGHIPTETMPTSRPV